jgi:hypothetical protein
VDRDKLTTTIYDEFSADLIAVYRSVPPIPGAKMPFDNCVNAATSSQPPRVSIARSMTPSSAVSDGRLLAATICSDMSRRAAGSFHAVSCRRRRASTIAEVVAVGAPLDLQAGTNAGLRAVVGVLTGASSAENLRREPHTHILPGVANLPILLASKL